MVLEMRCKHSWNSSYGRCSRYDMQTAALPILPGSQGSKTWKAYLTIAYMHTLQCSELHTSVQLYVHTIFVESMVEWHV